jgi:hypothetical protein
LKGEQGIQGEIGDDGPKGDTGDSGAPFRIVAIFESVAAMSEAADEFEIGDMVLIDTGDVEDPDNAKLYVREDDDDEP